MTEWSKKMALHARLDGGSLYAWEVYRDGEPTGAVITSIREGEKTTKTVELGDDAPKTDLGLIPSLDFSDNPAALIPWLEEHVPE